MSAVRGIMLANPKSVEDALDGSHPSLVFLMGQMHRHSMARVKELEAELAEWRKTPFVVELRTENKRLRDALDVDRITNIIVDRELVPTVCEDSGQVEWARGEARKLAEAISYVPTEGFEAGRPTRQQIRK